MSGDATRIAVLRIRVEHSHARAHHHEQGSELPMTAHPFTASVHRLLGLPILLACRV
jgi:hypothetical protein